MGKFSIIAVALSCIIGFALGYNLGWIGALIVIPIAGLLGFLGAHLDWKYK